MDYRILELKYNDKLKKTRNQTLEAEAAEENKVKEEVAIVLVKHITLKILRPILPRLTKKMRMKMKIPIQRPTTRSQL